MIELMNHYASVWLNWQWAMLWQMAVLVGVVALADRLIRKWAWPQLRYALWLLVLLKLVLPPTLTSPVSLTSQVPSLAQKTIPAQTSRALLPTSEPVVPGVSQVAVPKPEATNVMAEIASAPVATTEPSATAVISTSQLSWAAYAMGTWLIGIAALSIGLTIHLRRLVSDHTEEHPDGVPAWFDEALAQATTEIGLRRRPRVVFTSRVACPAVFGLFRPVLLMPAERVATMTRLETRHVLLHELAHVKRGDLLTHGAYMVLVTVYWFNPPALADPQAPAKPARAVLRRDGRQVPARRDRRLSRHAAGHRPGPAGPPRRSRPRTARAVRGRRLADGPPALARQADLALPLATAGPGRPGRGADALLRPAHGLIARSDDRPGPERV